MKEAQLFKSSKDCVVCQLCHRFCKIKESESGFCKVRVNKGGKLFTLTYGKLSALESRPIEIKPFFHFKPGSTSMTFATSSCNFDCPWCQNWRISRALPSGSEISPEYVVKKALENGDLSVCGSLNEPPLLFEYLLDVFRISKDKNLFTTLVSNGYMSILALRELRNSGLDALKVDVKGGEEVYKKFLFANVKNVWKIVKEAIKLGIHVEIVNLLVTNVSDSEESIREVVENHLRYANSDVPIHFTRYFPAYLFKEKPTEIKKLEMAVEIAKKDGISFAYLGNVPGHRYENTFCPNCGELLIRRFSYQVLENRIRLGKCPNCGKEIYGVW
ncbi:MAG: AmmeMemoRadiSam system radical SAM enzyme [Archaeoglobaceae archaeon]|nr:AmmeMemoRadiSam system radical SAM enzyme [Archaeoglobaceae archaeon]MDW8118820.1 AmmeMemoRadiSam system radical SAM enzyme [Archaeoglobaceae archaeon]